MVLNKPRYTFFSLLLKIITCKKKKPELTTKTKHCCTAADKNKNKVNFHVLSAQSLGGKLMRCRNLTKTNPRGLKPSSCQSLKKTSLSANSGEVKQGKQYALWFNGAWSQWWKKGGGGKIKLGSRAHKVILKVCYWGAAHRNLKSVLCECPRIEHRFQSLEEVWAGSWKTGERSLKANMVSKAWAETSSEEEEGEASPPGSRSFKNILD